MKHKTEPFIGIVEIAKYLGYSVKSIEEFVKCGCPFHTDSDGKQTFQINAVVDWAASQTRKNQC